jgi:LysM repeat protein
VLAIIALHGVVFLGLLQQGCKQKGLEPAEPTMAASTNVDLGPVATLPYGDTSSPPAGVSTQQVAKVLPGGQAATNAAPAAAPAPETTPPAPSAPTEYTIAAGDTLAKVAKQQGVSLAALMEANAGVNPRRLQIGQKIKLPPAQPATKGAGDVGAAPPTEPAVAAEAAKVYRVRGGDNLTKIARQHGVTIKALREANSLKTDRIKVGQKLKIPAAKASASGQGADSGGTLSASSATQSPKGM